MILCFTQRKNCVCLDHYQDWNVIVNCFFTVHTVINIVFALTLFSIIQRLDFIENRIISVVFEEIVLRAGFLSDSFFLLRVKIRFALVKDVTRPAIKFKRQQFFSWNMPSWSELCLFCFHCQAYTVKIDRSPDSFEIICHKCGKIFDNLNFRGNDDLFLNL